MSRVSQQRTDSYLRKILPPLPPAALPWGAAGRAGGGAEFGAGLMRVGGLEDFALLAKRLLGK
jgi:hypothetical protein